MNHPMAHKNPTDQSRRQTDPGRAMAKPPLMILLASPRGFCAGVDRAIQIVERALARFGRPIYVRHEIVHNRFVVERLERKGAVFVDELDQVPDGARVIFSAHGVPKAVPAEAERREEANFLRVARLSRSRLAGSRLARFGLTRCRIGWCREEQRNG